MSDAAAPQNLKYSRDHEWVDATADAVRIGITDFAQDQLGDVVFVDLPEVGDSIEAGEDFGEVESTKSVSDLKAPVSGEVLRVNEALEDEPEIINSDPYGEGWMLEIALSDPSEIEALLDAEAYRAHVESEGA
ncbi:glycine cleavage system protein GcvH [Brevibacterium sp. HMSC07C04]|uniref:glycine cleavage system protein GcvH n=1 Tax=Brevibacterium sp. HMSC07C04 TaxID=1581130 RepID=UPI0008A59E52|nr:glycine cleavage system protein GcvH [Brevibacterium sp. HMSC07C04]OFS27907.1 glycine cleavage system protein H [Brevibacterium sp. HMSC07C04]